MSQNPPPCTEKGTERPQSPGSMPAAGTALRCERLAGGTPVWIDRVHRFGSDALLLARFCRLHRQERACDLGSGCGIIALCWHDEGHRGPCLTVELQPAAAALLQKALQTPCLPPAAGMPVSGSTEDTAADTLLHDAVQTPANIPAKAAAGIPENISADAAAIAKADARVTVPAKAAAAYTPAEAAKKPLTDISLQPSLNAAADTLTDTAATAAKSLINTPADAAANAQTDAPAAAAGTAPPTVAPHAAGPAAFAHAGHIRVVCGDLRRQDWYTQPEKAALYDVVCCNPPYFTAGLRSPDPQRAAARHQLTASTQDICAAAARLLRDGGRLCLCQRPAALPEVIAACLAAGLQPKRLQLVRSRPNKQPWLFLLDARKAGGVGLQWLEDLILPS